MMPSTSQILAAANAITLRSKQIDLLDAELGKGRSVYVFHTLASNSPPSICNAVANEFVAAFELGLRSRIQELQEEIMEISHQLSSGTIDLSEHDQAA